jgi:hypothetical protein
MAATEGRDGREVEDDHDLLTFGEARARIAEELAKERAHLAELELRGADFTAVRTRILQLTEAGQRNARGASDQIFEQFFGYAPRPHEPA